MRKSEALGLIIASCLAIACGGEIGDVAGEARNIPGPDGSGVDDTTLPPDDTTPPPDRKTSSKPSALNTGPSNPGILEPWPYGSTYLDTPGAVYENFSSSCLEIDADDVTLRNFVINCNGVYGIKVYNGHQGIVIEDGEITGGFDSAGILGLGYTGSRLYVHDGKGDGLKTEGSTPGQTIIEDSLVECLGAGVSDPHTDAVQMAGVSSHPGITFRRNNFNMPDGGNPSCPGAAGNSAIIIDAGNTNIVMEDGWVNGGTYTFDVDAVDLTVRNMLIGRDALFGVKLGNFGGTWTNNRWEDTVEIIP